MAIYSQEPKIKKSARPRMRKSKNVANMLEAIAAVIGEDEAQPTDMLEDLEPQLADHEADTYGPPTGYVSDEEWIQQRSQASPQAQHPGHYKNDESGDENKSDDAGEKKEEKKPMPPEKKRWLIIIAAIVAVILIILIILFWLWDRQFETTDDAFVDGHISQVSPQANGRIEALLVDDNQHVEKGQLLAEIDPRDYEDKLDQAQAQYTQAVAQIGLQRANLGQARANVKMAAADLYQAKHDLRRYRNVDPQAITRQQLDNAVATERSAAAKLDANRQAVAATEAQIKAAISAALAASAHL